MWPEWLPIFEPSISKISYDTMISKMKAHMDEKSMDARLILCSVYFFLCGGCLACFSIISRAKDIKKNLKNIGDEYNGAKVELSQMCTPTALTEEAQGWDQYGNPCQKAFNVNKHRSETKSCWPPLGYNIILKAPEGVDIRSAWPKGPRGVPLAAPLVMPVMPVTPIVQAVMRRENLNVQKPIAPPHPSAPVLDSNSHQIIGSPDPASIFDQLKTTTAGNT